LLTEDDSDSEFSDKLSELGGEMALVVFAL
jgi:hypothetical protein